MNRVGVGASDGQQAGTEACPWCGAARVRDVVACPACGSRWPACEPAAGTSRRRGARATDPLVVGAVALLGVLALLALGYLAWVGVAWWALTWLGCGGAGC